MTQKQAIILIRSIAPICLFLAAGAGGCAATATSDIEETAQQIGDSMASVDEAGGNTGTLSFIQSNTRTFARLAPSELKENWLASLFEKNSYAATCGASTEFSTCSVGALTRTFGSCTLGAATFVGTVVFSFSTTPLCVVTAQNDYVSRVPNFTVTGRRGATLTVTKTGSVGQRITRGVGTNYSFTNDGINRVFATGTGSRLFDFTTTTGSAITVTGNARTSRVMTGGSLHVVNNLAASSCDYIPSQVTWSRATCNCPVSGSWSGSCSDGKSSTLTLTGCGTASFTMGTDSQDFTFDRCTGS